MNAKTVQEIQSPDNNNDDSSKKKSDSVDDKQKPSKKRSFDTARLSTKYLGTPFWSVFQKYVFYINCYDPVGSGQMIPFSSLGLCEKICKFYGAKVSPEITLETTHIIVDPAQSESDITHLKAINQILKNLQEVNAKPQRSHKRNHHSSPLNAHAPYVISKEWVTESVASRNDLDESEFLVNLDQLVHTMKDQEKGNTEIEMGSHLSLHSQEPLDNLMLE